MPTRNFWGRRIVHEEDKVSFKRKASEGDIRWEKIKIFIWILLGLLWVYYVIQPQIHFE